VVKGKFYRKIEGLANQDQPKLETSDLQETLEFSTEIASK
jgi:hypothetical protein